MRPANISCAILATGFGLAFPKLTTVGGYVDARVILESDDPHSGVHSNRPIPLSLPLHSTHSQSEESEGSEVSEGGHAREDVRRAQDLFVDCDAYRDHQTRYVYTNAGWRCRICSPEYPA